MKRPVCSRRRKPVGNAEDNGTTTSPSDSLDGSWAVKYRGVSCANPALAETAACNAAGSMPAYMATVKVAVPVNSTVTVFTASTDGDDVDMIVRHNA